MTYADAALPPAVRSSAELAVVNEGTDKRRPWTDAECEVMRSEYGYGRARDIAARLGRTVGEVQQKAWRMGITQAHDSGSKRCPACRLQLPRAAYYPLGTAPSGRAKFSTYCRQCSRRRAIRDDQLEAMNLRRKAACEQLSDSYVVSTLRLNKQSTPDELLALKREQLLTRRLARQLKKAADESSKDPR